MSEQQAINGKDCAPQHFIALSRVAEAARHAVRNDDVLAKAIAQAVVRIVRDATAPLEAKIAALEAAASAFTYKGAWSESAKYRRNNVVSMGGAIYCSAIDGADSRPGVGNDWLLMIPRPRDGRDAQPVPVETEQTPRTVRTAATERSADVVRRR